MASKAFLAGDVDSIKEYVFETSSLPQIRGGSELLQECEATIRGELLGELLKNRFGYEVLYCAGGGFLLKVDAAQAQDVADAIEKLYRERTLVATVTIVFEKDAPPSAPPGFAPDGIWVQRLLHAASGVPLDGTFSQRVRLLYGRIAEVKNQKSAAPFYEALPFGKRCERCGKRIASRLEPVQDCKAICEVCWRRDEKGRAREREVRGTFNREFWERYQHDIQAQQPQDLDTLVQEAKRTHLAFFYADGNDIGGLLQQAASEEEYRQLSVALTEGTKEALYKALWEVCGAQLRQGEYWPFDIVNIGGDDVTVLIQPGYAWELGVRFLELFEDEVTKRIPGPLRNTVGKVTASAGIAIADVKFPIRYLEHLATDLLKKAKRVAKDKGQSALTYLWLPTPTASEKAEPLMSIYEIGEHVHLTARPYTLEAARALRGAIPTVASWPRTTRHRWAEALEHGVLPSVNFIHYDLAREVEEDARAKLALLVQVAQAVDPHRREIEVPTPIWWQDQNGDYRTALLDLLELAELHAMRPGFVEGAE